MTLTIAQIAAKAIGVVQKAVPDAISTATLIKTIPGAYDVDIGTHAEQVTTYPCRSVQLSNDAAQDQFPDYVAGGLDVVLMLEGLTVAPAEGDTITIGARTRTIRATPRDLMGAGSVWHVLAR